ncbi:MAG: Uncharacterized protein FD147_322 [Chloroflexi bacterium]|nr:MAG: Uncharacterized protein FD147_322 [Chloroflexota bacterium]
MKPEIVQAVIDKVHQKTGLFSKQTWRLVVTDVRLIFAVQVKNGVDYMRQDPALTLAANPANFAIPLDELQVIEIYKGDFDDNAPDTMVVKTNTDKMTFIISNSYSVSSQLKKALGNKVK